MEEGKQEVLILIKLFLPAEATKEHIEEWIRHVGFGKDIKSENPLIFDLLESNEITILKPSL